MLLVLAGLVAGCGGSDDDSKSTPLTPMPAPNANSNPNAYNAANSSSLSVAKRSYAGSVNGSVSYIVFGAMISQTNGNTRTISSVNRVMLTQNGATAIDVTGQTSSGIVTDQFIHDTLQASFSTLIPATDMQALRGSTYTIIHTATISAGSIYTIEYRLSDGSITTAIDQR